MSKFGVWAYCYFGDVEAESQGEAQCEAENLVSGVEGVEISGSVDVIPVEEGAGGVCC